MVRNKDAAMLHLVLFQPEIAPNTGNIGRLCALTRSRLHLIHPLGFEITDRNLKRAGMDYWKSLDVHEHAGTGRRSGRVPTGRNACGCSRRRRSKASGVGALCRWRWVVLRQRGCRGAPAWLHDEIGTAQRVTIPHVNTELRSLNLSTAAGIACYEALRQIGLPS